MALYKVDRYFTQSNDAAFYTEYTPGSATPHSGIYKCLGCGHEIVSEAKKPFPPQNHHEHNPYTQGKIRWMLIAFADHTSSIV